MGILMVLFWLWTGVIVVDVTGYLWRRFLAHEGRGGLLGAIAIFRHKDHHGVKYPGTDYFGDKQGPKIGYKNSRAGYAYNSSHERH